MSVTPIDDRLYPAVIEAGDCRYQRYTDPRHPEYVLYRYQKAPPFRAKWDEKRGRLFFVALHDRTIKLWTLPDVAQSESSVRTATVLQHENSHITTQQHQQQQPFTIPHTPPQSQLQYTPEHSVAPSESVLPYSSTTITERLIANGDHDQQRTQVFMQEVDLLTAQHASGRNALIADERVEREGLAKQESADARVAEAWGRRRAIFREEWRFIENIEAEDRQRIGLWESSDYQVVLRNRAAHRVHVYALAAVVSDETSQRRVLECVATRVFSEIFASFDTQFASVKQMFEWSGTTAFHRAKRKYHQVITQEEYQRNVILRNEATEIAYLFGRMSRDATYLVEDEEAPPLEAQSLVEKAYLQASLPFAKANALFEEAIFGQGTLFRDFLISQGKIYHEYIRSLWGRPVFFFKSELESHAYRHFERRYGPRLAALDAPSPRIRKQLFETSRGTVSVAAVPSMALRRYNDRRRAGLQRTPLDAPVASAAPQAPELTLAESSSPWDPALCTAVSIRPFGEVLAVAPSAQAVTKFSAMEGVFSRSVRVLFDNDSRVGVGFGSDGVFFGWCSDGSLTLSPSLESAGDLKVNYVSGDTLTVTLDFNELALLVAKNGDDLGIAFRFTAVDDPEPLRFAVCFNKAGESAVLL